jgi:acetylornithine deacetylase/succinyl-diaminopimelate desuccinylase-like protein
LPGKQDVYQHIDGHIPQHIAKIQEFTRQPSISQTGEGIKEAAEMIVGYLQKLGASGAEAVTMGTEHHPVVWGKLDYGAKKTLLVYTMYDVMPVAGQKWSVPPFEGALVELPPYKKVIMVRGATNSKGPMMALYNTLESIIAVDGKLPVNVVFVSEGEEERNSVALGKFVKQYAEGLRSDALFFPGRETTEDGLTWVRGGSEGIAYVHLETSGKRWGRGPTEFDIHGGMKREIDSPAWRHIEMLSTLVSRNGNRVEVEGWYDNVRQPTEQDLELIDEMIKYYDPESIKKQSKVKVFMDDAVGRQVLINSNFTTCLNLDGIWGGSTTPGAGSILPHKVTSKHSIRLIPDQEPEEILGKLKKHLVDHGYADVEVKVIGAYSWVRADYNSQIARAAFRTYEEFGAKYVVHPCAGTLGEGESPALPLAHFAREPLNLPCVIMGLGRGARAHSPDEYMVIEGSKAKYGEVHGLAGLEKSYAGLIYNYAETA